MQRQFNIKWQSRCLNNGAEPTTEPMLKLQWGHPVWTARFVWRSHGRSFCQPSRLHYRDQWMPVVTALVTASVITPPQSMCRAKRLVCDNYCDSDCSQFADRAISLWLGHYLAPQSKHAGVRDDLQGILNVLLNYCHLNTRKNTVNSNDFVNCKRDSCNWPKIELLEPRGQNIQHVASSRN